jgi:pimeloyl-ACP methyl ester carboxylesterase
VCGTSVYYLRADADADAAAYPVPTHLLVHPLGAAGMFWLDLMGPLRGYGHVVAPDLPGALFGHTDAPGAHAVRVGPNARFVRAFISALDLDRVVVHGWSMGGLVAARFAAIAPDRVQRLVLANAPLPAPLTMRQRVGWQTLGRLVLTVGPVLARALVRLWGRRAIDWKLAYLREWTPSSTELGGDPSRIAAENIALWREQLAKLRANPNNVGLLATAIASVVWENFVDQRPTLAAIDRITAPTLLLWGEEDPLVERATVDRVLARRPDWALHGIAGAGHAAPLEVPDRYVEAVGQWLRQPIH